MRHTSPCESRALACPNFPAESSGTKGTPSGSKGQRSYRVRSLFLLPSFPKMMCCIQFRDVRPGLQLGDDFFEAASSFFGREALEQVFDDRKIFRVVDGQPVGRPVL